YLSALSGYLLVEDELALTGDLEPVERAMVLDADLVLALEQRVGRQGPHRQRHPVEAGRRLLGTADAVTEVIGIVGVHFCLSLSCAGRLARRCKNADSFLDSNSHVY